MKGKTRRTVVVLAVVAMIAGLLAIPALPAAAAGDGVASAPALHSACPAGVIPASGFTDTVGSFAASEIDCIAYYGVTKGTSATTYDPASVITREQMALFLTRAAGPAGIALAASPADPGFSDDDALSAESQLAIAQLYALGITKGTSATTYSPSGTVTREQMALFLSRFLDKAVKGPGGSQPKGVTPDDAPFSDISGVTFEAHEAILDLYELGVTTGTTATTFSPAATVTREQMGAFIGRALSHTNARPAGVNIQTSATDGYGARAGVVAVTYRDASFMPMANVLIDVFNQNYSTSATTVPSPLNTDGTCDLAEVTPTSGAVECTIENGDFATNANGNYVIGTVTTSDGDTDIWWAWSGAVGAAFDADTVAVSSIKVASSTAATTYTAVPSSSLIPFGSTATATFTLDQKQAGVVITVTETRTQDGNVSTASTKVTTDADGKATFTVAAFTDPLTATGDTATSALSFSSTLTDPAGFTINVSDATPVATSLKVDSTTGWAEVVTTAAVKSVSATILDQFGSPMANEPVSFKLNTDAAVTRTSNASGIATFSWSGGTANGLDTVVIDSVNVPAVTDVTFNFYWVDELAADDNTVATGETMLVRDAANDAIVFRDTAGLNGAAPTNAYFVAYYDSNDQFKIAGAAATFEAFDKEIGLATPTYAKIYVFNYKDTAAGISELRVLN